MQKVTNTQIPETGFLRLRQILGDKKTGTPGLIPVSRTAFLNNVRTGLYPGPIKLGARTTAWRVSDIRALIDRLGA